MDTGKSHGWSPCWLKPSKGASLSALYCGPGTNVVRTAEIVGKALGVRPKRVEEFRNLDQGLWQGLQIDEIRRRNTKLYRQWIEDPETICPPQGETFENAMGRIKAAFRPILRRHHDESIALVVAEPLASMVASYLRCEPRVQLDERWSCGGFELIEIAPLLLWKRDDLREPWRCQRGTDERQTPGTSTLKASGCLPASGCAAKDARRLSSCKQVEQNLGVCPECNHHFVLSAHERIADLLDSDTFEEWFAGLQPLDPLGFNDRRPYPERIKTEQERTGSGRGGRRRPGLYQRHPNRPGAHR